MSDRNFHNSYENQTQKISKSVFVTNFPEDSSARDLRKMCSDYDTVVDVFIPLKRSKSGKHFAFVRFIKVINLERLVSNLYTIWIGRYHLHANYMRFERPQKPNSSIPRRPNHSTHKETNMENSKKSFVYVFKRGSQSHVTPEITKPALVLDETCIKEFDFGMSLMGRAKDVSAIPNLPCIIYKEGFQNVKLSYLRGIWVLFEFDSLASKEKSLNHSGIGSWFTELIQATSSFENDERVVRISIEGLPIKAWTPNTFRKIASLWGEYVEWEEADLKSLSYDQDDLSSDRESQEGDVANKDDNNESDVDRESESNFMHENDTAYKDDYLRTFIDRWEGDTVIMGDFNEETNYDVHSLFRVFHSWFAMEGFNSFVETTWKSLNIFEPNGLIRLKKKLQALKIAIKAWSKEANKRITRLNDLQELNNRNAIEISQKDKIRWSIEGEENSKYFHGIMNKKRSQLAIRGTLANGEWISKPHKVKNEFFTHFKKQFLPIQAHSICFDFTFPTRISSYQVQDLKRTITYEEKLFTSHSRVLNAGLYKGTSLNDSFMISHLFYAGDVVFIGEWYNNNIQALLSVLRHFYLALGLKINLYKRKLIWIGVSSNVVAVAASLIGCSILTAPFNYLGLKVGSNISRITSWDDVISKVSSRLSKWKLKLLSICGRLSLLKSVLTLIPLYHMSIFKVPVGVLNHLESIRRNLFYDLMIQIGSLLGLAGIWMPRGGVEQKNYGLLCSKVVDLVLLNILDKWCWSLEGSQEFSVKSSCNLIDNTILPKAEVPTRWLRVVPIKVNVHAWRVCLDKLPTRANLSLRGMDIPSIACPLCNSAVESSSHIFLLVPCLAKFGEIF
nr:RNA-directed DNA polymerase, eukaryota, nucleotide-binding alpha-beta plait domain protein [Tanacetum cinerariifolium]